jgi:hypothetical protein
LGALQTYVEINAERFQRVREAPQGLSIMTNPGLLKVFGPAQLLGRFMPDPCTLA